MKHTFRDDLLKHVLIILVLASAFLPLYVMLATACKDNREFFVDPFGIPRTFHPENWVVGWNAVKDLIATTMVISVSSVALRLALAIPAAYFFAKVDVPFKEFLWFLFMALIMLPSAANLLTLYVLLKNLNMLNSIWTLP